MRALVGVVALVAGIFAATSAAQDAPTACTWDTAVRTSVRALERGAHYGQCVRTRGTVDGWTLSVTRRAGRSVVQEIEIGAYYAEGVDVKVERRVEVLARVGSCDGICAGPAEPNVICMPIGWCHYHGGAYVKIEAMR